MNPLINHVLARAITTGRRAATPPARRRRVRRVPPRPASQAARVTGSDR